MIKAKEIPLGVRISDKIKRTLDAYCRQSGISRKFFVEEAIKEKLLDIMEELDDVALAKERLKHPAGITEKEMEEYFAKRIKA